MQHLLQLAFQMCFWLGCPMVKEEKMYNNMIAEDKIQTQNLDETELKRKKFWIVELYINHIK